jgi:hypothetical protein
MIEPAICDVIALRYIEANPTGPDFATSMPVWRTLYMFYALLAIGVWYSV